MPRAFACPLCWLLAAVVVLANGAAVRPGAAAAVPARLVFLSHDSDATPAPALLGVAPTGGPERAVAKAVAPGLSWQAPDNYRLFPAPRGSYLAVLEPVIGGLAPAIRVVDTNTGDELPFAAGLANLSERVPLQGSPQVEALALAAAAEDGVGRWLGWHPDGRHALYSDWGGGSGLWSVDVTGATPAVRLSAEVADTAAWSPDGQRLAYAGRWQDPGGGPVLWLAQADGSDPKAVLHAGDSMVGGLAWSPDGSELAYTRGGSQIWLMPAAGGEPRQVAADYAAGWDFLAPAWSPDGSTLAYPALTKPVAADEAGAYEETAALLHVSVRLLDVASGRSWSPWPASGSLYPAWAPDGSLALLAADVNGAAQVWTLQADGSQAVAQTAGAGWHSMPTWLAPAGDDQAAIRDAPVASAGAVEAPAPAAPAVAPFLATPYAGSKRINSWFDHKYPTYSAAPNSTYNRVVRYDGQDLPDCGIAGGAGCIWYNGHDGIDFGLYYEPIRAAAAGTVTWAGWSDVNCQNGSTCSYGLWVSIDHGNGYSTRYGHMTAVGVVKGQKVRQGQIIGNSGNTGNSSGPHLHFSLHTAGKAVDPFGWTGASPDPWQQYSGVASVALWALGEWAGAGAPPLAAPQTLTPVVIDDGAAGYTDGCQSQGCAGWTVVTGQGNAGDLRWTALKSAADEWARWTPTLTYAPHEVWVYVPPANASARQANFAVTIGTSVQKTIVDEYAVGGRWLCLGEFDAPGGTGLSVSVSDATGETDLTRQLGVDAIKFVPRVVVLPKRTLLPLIANDYPPYPHQPVLDPIAAPESAGSYTISWSASQNATSYVLQRATDAEFTSPVQVYAGSARSYTAASQGIATYYYRVLGRNSLGDSNWSDPQSVEVRWETESNNSKTAASGPLQTNVDYYGYPYDWGDYFSIDITDTSPITVELTGYTGGGGQLSLYNPAGTLVRRDTAAPFKTDYTPTPGRYVIYIYTASGYNKNQAYTLRVSQVLPAP